MFQNLEISKKAKVISSTTFLNIAFHGRHCNTVIVTAINSAYNSFN